MLHAAKALAELNNTSQFVIVNPVINPSTASDVQTSMNAPNQARVTQRHSVGTNLALTCVLVQKVILEIHSNLAVNPKVNVFLILTVHRPQRAKKVSNLIYIYVIICFSINVHFKRYQLTLFDLISRTMCRSLRWPLWTRSNLLSC